MTDHLPDTIPTFETWYAVYPLKKGKKAARAKYKAALMETTPEALQKAVEAQASIWHDLTGYQGKKGKAKQEALKYHPFPATWLHQGRDEDEEVLEKIARQEANKIEPVLIDPGENWYKEKKALLQLVGELAYRSWLVGIDFMIHPDGKSIVALFDTGFKLDWVKNNYQSQIETAFKRPAMFRRNEDLIKGIEQ